MTKFIRLHNVRNGKIVTINVDSIESYGEIDKELYDCDDSFVGSTYIVTNGTTEDRNVLAVEESEMEIFTILCKLPGTYIVERGE